MGRTFDRIYRINGIFETVKGRTGNRGPSHAAPSRQRQTFTRTIAKTRGVGMAAKMRKGAGRSGDAGGNAESRQSVQRGDPQGHPRRTAMIYWECFRRTGSGAGCPAMTWTFELPTLTQPQRASIPSFSGPLITKLIPSLWKSVASNSKQRVRQ